VSSDEIDIYTDDSKIKGEDNTCLVSCAIYIPNVNIVQKFKLNDMTSSYMAEVYAIDKALNLFKSQSSNICTDSFCSFLQFLENSQLSLFLIALIKLNQSIAELIYKIIN